MRRGLLCLFAFLLTALPMQPDRLYAQDAESETEPEYNGSIALHFDPPKTASFKPIQSMLQESRIFDDTVVQLNDTLSLPADLQVVFAECGQVNAFYDPQSQRIIMCYELISEFGRQFTENYEDQQQAEQAVVDATVFVFHHELGHALVHLLKLPITGKEEDAVDDLATLVLLHDWEGGDEAALNAAEAFYIAGDQQESELADIPYWDEHSLSKQRYYSIACVVFGSDPEAHKDLIGEGLPENRAVRCPGEYQQKANSWNTLLADYWDHGGADEGSEESAEEASAAH